MDTQSSANADVYRRATDAAATERREIQAEIATLEARIASLRTRDASLESLVRTLRELLPSALDAPTPYIPSYTLIEDSPDLRHRSSISDAELRGRNGSRSI